MSCMENESRLAMMGLARNANVRYPMYETEKTNREGFIKVLPVALIACVMGILMIAL